MESSDIIEQIGQNYIIKEIIGSGCSADVFLVYERETKKEYAAKVFNESRKLDCDNEIKIINILKEENNPNIIKIIESGEGDIIRKNKPKINTKYYILEYASFGNIFDYIFYRKKGLGELYSKIIFYKIVEGVKFCHEHNICHRDLKLENILLNDDFCPKICDFGFACINAPDLKDTPGTSAYLAPEVRQNMNYDGKKADIFCLGSILIILVVGIKGFYRASIFDNHYYYIFKENIELYWKLIEAKVSEVKQLSKEFKNLYIQMITYEPNKRITAEGILNHPWFDEIKEIKKDKIKMDDLEEEIKSKFIEIKDEVKNENKIELENKSNKDEENEGSSGYRGGKDEEICFYNKHKPEVIDTYINMNNCIKIKNLLNPVHFMNSLCHKIIKEFGKDNCAFEIDEKKLKLNVIFEEEEEKEEIPKGIKEELKKLGINEDMEDNERTIELIIQIKLYKYSDDYILRFIQEKGDRYYFLDKFEIISKLVKNIIS